MNKKHPFVAMGVVGISISLVLNLFNQFVLGVGSGAWWSVWFPTYIVWVVFLASGIRLSKHRKTDA
jgi:hypothetical protein